MWSTCHVFQDAVLLAKLRAELDSLLIEGTVQRLRIDNVDLIELPTLQSVYSNTIRLYLCAYRMRYTDHGDVQLNGWLFPKGSTIMVTIELAHTDTRV